MQLQSTPVILPRRPSVRREVQAAAKVLVGLMPTFDPCGFCLCVCLAEPHVEGAIVSPFLLHDTYRPSRSVIQGLAARAVQQTRACSLPYETWVAHSSSLSTGNSDGNKGGRGASLQPSR